MGSEALPVEVAAQEEVPWRTLHPASLAVNLVPRAFRVARTAWPLLLALFIGERTEGMRLFDLLIVATFFLMAAGSTVVHFLTLRYRVAGGRLEIASGLVQRQVRAIDPDRVQNVEMVRNVFHKLSGLVEVRVETASGTEAEGQLSALSVQDAQALIEALEQARRRSRRQEHEGELPELIHNDLRDVALYGVTATRVGGVLLLIGFLLEATGWMDPEQLGGLLLRGTTVAVVVVGAVGGAWLLGTSGAILRHFGFRLLHDGRSLVAEEGLFTRRRVELREDKLQVITVSEPWIRRHLGFGSMIIETASASAEAGGTSTKAATVPAVDTDEIPRLLRQVLRKADADLDQLQLLPPHPRALVMSLIRSQVRGAVFGGLLAWFFWPWGVVALGLLPLGAAFAWLDHRHQGWRVTDRMVVFREGYWHRRTQVVLRAKIQSLEVVQGPVLRRYGLGRLVIRVAGTGVGLPLIAWEQARDMVDELNDVKRPSAAGGAVEPAHAPGVMVRRAAPDELQACIDIRKRVFIEEQGVAPELEVDGLDGEALHLLAELDGALVGTARMRTVGEVAKAERVAVLAEHRGRKVGAALMAALEDEARAAGLREVRLGAQVPVIPFYERLGYQAEGEVFEDAGIPHRLMRKALQG